MKFVAITQKVRLLGRVSTLSCHVVIHGILKHTKAEARLVSGHSFARKSEVGNFDIASVF
jgi:hypothetical protein